MKVVYAINPVAGKYSHPPVASRVARETLAAIIDEHIRNIGLIRSYSVTSDRVFQYPDHMPDLKDLADFYDGVENRQTEEELRLLFEVPKRVYAAHKDGFRRRLDRATDDDMVGLLERYYPAEPGTRDRYENALALLESKWASYSKIKQKLVTCKDSGLRSDLLGALKVLDCPVSRGLILEIGALSALLSEGRRNDAKDMVTVHYLEWRKRNLAQFYSACGAAKHEMGGYWIARMAVTECHYDLMADIKSVLSGSRKAYQVLSVPCPHSVPE